MKAKIITNPFIVYCLAFFAVLILYPLHWSEWYPELSISLLGFFAITFLISLFMGLVLHKRNYFSYCEIHYNKKSIWICTVMVFFSYLIEFAYMRVIPLFAILQGSDYDYTTFGI